MKKLAKQVKKKKKKKMKRLTKISLMLFLVILIIVLIGASGVFSVKEIEIKKEGNKVGWVNYAGKEVIKCLKKKLRVYLK